MNFKILCVVLPWIYHHDPKLKQERLQWIEALFYIYSCLRQKTQLKRTLLHIIKQDTISSIVKLIVMLYSICTE